MANVITFFRVVIALVVLALAQLNPMMNALSVGLVILLMLLDALDGYVARYLNISTLHGSIYDILADRIIENIFFIYFATLALFSVWFAVIIMIRGLTIDAIRTLYFAEGKTAFGSATLHHQRWKKWLVCSALSRGSYNTLKMLTFALCAALLMPKSFIFALIAIKPIQATANVCLWLTVALSILRAVPVLVDGLKKTPR